MKKNTVFFLLVFFIAVEGFPHTIETIPNPKTAYSNDFVSNPDGIISPSILAEINTTLNSLEESTGTEVAVVAVNTIGNEDIKVFATSLFKHWGIGKKNADNGLLILFVLDQRATTFETGYGIEGVLPDIVCGRIQRQAMIPYFREEKYSEGLLAGVQETTAVLRGEDFSDKASYSSATANTDWNKVLKYVIITYFFFILLVVYWVQRAGKKVKNNAKLKDNLSRYSELNKERSSIVMGGSFLSAISGFLLLFVSHIPALLPFAFLAPVTTIPGNLLAKRKMRKLRSEPITCDACAGKMHLLSEKEEDKYLNLSQQFEEKLDSVDYDVFICDTCKNETIHYLNKPKSPYSRCPRCDTKAFRLDTEKVIVAPTYFSAGTERISYKCKFCDYEEKKNRKIPRLTRSAVASGGSFSSGSGGFGGGSFGGGRSGGGGATSRW